MPLGDVLLKFKNTDNSGFSRSLDLSTGLNTVKANGCVSEAFSSYIDRVSAYRITAEKPFSVKIKAKSKLKYNTETEENSLFLLGNAPDYAAPNYLIKER